MRHDIERSDIERHGEPSEQSESTDPVRIDAQTRMYHERA